VNPSPKNPALQVHKKEPMVSVHCALGSQGLPAHSLISKTRRGFFVQMMLGCDINACYLSCVDPDIVTMFLLPIKTTYVTWL
jgi:hypothetical protein